MTFFTRIILDGGVSRTRWVLASLERLHAIIARATTEDTPSPADPHLSRTLWRLDPDKNGKKLKLYIVSAKEPSVDILAQELHIDKDRDYATSPYEPFLSQLEREQQWAFRLQANPTKSIKTEGYSTRGKRVGILKPEDQIEWLWKQARKFGFHMPLNRVELPEVMVREAESVDFARQGSTVTLMRVVFDGILAVDDPELLRTALTEGIGRAKGYGNGLLTLVPLVGERSRG